MGFFMIGLRQNQNALPHPNFDYNNNGNNCNIALGFANTVLFWVATAVIQWFWRFIVYERFLDEPPSTKFLDLCTMCNISVFIMSENHKGYYLHGKSPYESADSSMEELLKNLNREGRGATNTRGLVGATGESQIFTFFATPLFRRQISKIYSYARPSHRTFFQAKYDVEKTSLARAEATVFLQSFINRQLGDGLSYVVRERLFAERLVSVTPAEFRTNTEPKCIMYPDDHGFLSATFLGVGIEVNLVIHDILTYNAASMAFNNVGISVFLTYLMHLLRTHLRSWLGKRNLSDKSLIDSIFFV
jgi:meckelin